MTAVTESLATGGVARRARHLAWLLPLVPAVVFLGWWHTRPEPARYRTAPVTRGAIVRGVVATGSVNPVTTVQVGAFVSGTIRQLYCDYNTKVKANQLCARIDPAPYQTVVDQNAAALGIARAQLAKDQAALDYARLNHDRDARLLTQGVASQDNVDSDKSTLDQATAQVALDQATITEREAALRAAQVNLRYTSIVSPVQGTVISRNIDVGQTVAASFQTPMLFLVATDLTRMQVDASVSESDIGAVAVGQPATFTVEAYPDRTFTGKVVQIRRAPITVQNVVTYDVVIAVANPDQALLPGMTANSRLVTAQRDSVLRVPLQALRFSPEATGLGAGHGGRGHGGTGRAPASQVWVLRAGRLQPVPVVTGVDDGSLVEVQGSALAAGDTVVVGEADPSAAAAPAHGAGGLQPAMRFQ